MGVAAAMAEAVGGRRGAASMCTRDRPRAPPLRPTSCSHGLGAGSAVTNMTSPFHTSSRFHTMPEHHRKRCGYPSLTIADGARLPISEPFRASERMLIETKMHMTGCCTGCFRGSCQTGLGLLRFLVPRKTKGNRLDLVMQLRTAGKRDGREVDRCGDYHLAGAICPFPRSCQSHRSDLSCCFHPALPSLPPRYHSGHFARFPRPEALSANAT